MKKWMPDGQSPSFLFMSAFAKAMADIRRSLGGGGWLKKWRDYSLLGLLIAGVCLAAAPKKVFIVAIGDSTTAGTPFEKDKEGPYTAWMMKKHKEWQVQNLGIPGENTDQIRARFEKAVNQGPRYIIILGGVNDVYQGLPMDRIKSNLLYMYQRAKGKFVIAIAATVPPFNKASPAQNGQIRELNKWIKKTAEKYRMPVVDFNAAAIDPNDPDKLSGSPDGLHPDLGIYRAMGLAVTKVIEEMETTRPK